MSTPPSALPSPRQSFGLAAGAVLAEINLYGCDTLGVDGSMVDTVLRRDWGVEDRAALLAMLEWLAAGGHRKQVADTSLVGWDFGRLIMLARWGFTIGFLSQAEAWAWIERAAAQIESVFQSWLDVGESYLAGVRFWSKNKESVVDDTQAALDRLLSPKNAKSAWNKVPFPGAARNPDVARRMVAREVARAKEHATNLRNGVLLVAAIVLAIVAGRLFGPRFHPCDRLETRLCADLGAELCEVWKGPLRKVGSGSAMPHEARGRGGLADLGMHLLLGWDRARSHETCSAQLDDTVYPATLEGVRASVVATRR